MKYTGDLSGVELEIFTNVWGVYFSCDGSACGTIGTLDASAPMSWTYLADNGGEDFNHVSSPPSFPHAFFLSLTLWIPPTTVMQRFGHLLQNHGHRSCLS